MHDAVADAFILCICLFILSLLVGISVCWPMIVCSIIVFIGYEIDIVYSKRYLVYRDEHEIDENQASKKEISFLPGALYSLGLLALLVFIIIVLFCDSSVYDGNHLELQLGVPLFIGVMLEARFMLGISFNNAIKTDKSFKEKYVTLQENGNSILGTQLFWEHFNIFIYVLGLCVAVLAILKFFGIQCWYIVLELLILCICNILDGLRIRRKGTVPRFIKNPILHITAVLICIFNLVLAHLYASLLSITGLMFTTYLLIACLCISFAAAIISAMFRYSKKSDDKE